MDTDHTPETPDPERSAAPQTAATTDQTTEPGAASTADTAPAADPRPRPPQPSGRRLPTAALIAGVVLLVAMVASQVYLVTSLQDTRGDLADLEDDVAAIEGRITAFALDIAQIKDARDRAEGASPAPTPVEGVLPRFTPGAQDTALGLVVPPVSADEAYTGETVTIDPADGTKRIWLIWAHWCPYCQEELPLMADWYPPNADRFPGSELVTITTAIDPARDNPLDPYLEAEQFPFPVLRDDDDQLSARFGVSAFPFWVVTNGDGTVLFRTAGLLGEEQVDEMFTRLESIETP